MDLFDHAMQERMSQEAPLAARMRPRNLKEFVGQEDIIGEGRLLRRAIEADRLFSSIILWGPPGTGKTTMAQLIANYSQSHFESMSAVMAGKEELKEVIEGWILISLKKDLPVPSLGAREIKELKIAAG